MNSRMLRRSGEPDMRRLGRVCGELAAWRILEPTSGEIGVGGCRECSAPPKTRFVNLLLYPLGMLFM